MSCRDLKLLEGQDFIVNTHECDGERFRGLFRQSWDKIPVNARKTILDYWKCRELAPSFELSNLWGDSAHSYAQVIEMGYRMRFNAKSFSIMPEPPALFVIAHELAHVYNWATGTSNALFRSFYEQNTDETEVHEKFDLENEAKADALAVKWEFDKAKMDRFRMLEKMRGFEYACERMTCAPEVELSDEAERES